MKAIIKIVWIDGQHQFKSFDVLNISDDAAKLLIEKNKDNPRPRYIALEDGHKFGIVEKLVPDPELVTVAVPVPATVPVPVPYQEPETIQKRKYNKKK